jgi:hypothetical protein
MGPLPPDAPKAGGMPPPPPRPRHAAAAAKPAASPLDIEGPPDGLADGGAGRGPLSPLDRKIDRHLLPCLCLISVANYLGERGSRGERGRRVSEQ